MKSTSYSRKGLPRASSLVPLPMSWAALDELAKKLPAADQELIARVQSLRSPEVTTTHSGPLHLPSPQAVAEHFSRIVAKWVPHVFTPHERQTARLDCLRYLVIVRAIEKVERDIHPRQLPEEVKAQLAFARMSYTLRYFRVFRINDLPVEIISNILRLAIWDSMKRPVDARLRVTWTCRRWRVIALSDSTLWNAIWFSGAGARLDRAWAWFERAHQAPLDVRIDGDSSSDDENHEDDDQDRDDDEDQDDISESDAHAAVTDISTPPPTVGDIGQILLRLFTKLTTIRMLIITVNDWKSALLVLELLRERGPSCVPLLQRFELHRGGLKNDDRRNIPWPKITLEPFVGGAVAPSLAYLSLNGVAVDWSRSVVANLSTLDLRRLPATYSPDAVRFREILANCPRLQKLSMDGGGPKFEEPNGETIVPVDLPYLRTLVIADFSLQHAQFLCSQFTAPNVNDLTLMNVCGADYLPLFVQLTGTFPKVQLLTAYSVQFQSTPEGLSTMTRWLDSMPLLAYLRVANVANQFFGIFFRPGDVTKPVAPKLVTVDFQSIEPNIITQWVSDRHKYKTPLRQVYLSEDLVARINKDHIKVITSLCILAKLPRGATTPEEEALSRLDSNHS
ncbi:hypothetical protein C8F04DRAFT_989721 [Mycena alexandri]|uniref:F-box domain-containing protein n=1 Tax=Mycena alexandri TaxID=1745969 RepID=A0AAD6TH33_9AGAR|nr:hypothetical protein C8F04DRAFT_989721 [Mycena alexandri]